jgi:hypothetical protein
MSSAPDRVRQLERDLRAAARAFDDLPVAGDAWQQNQQRLAADRGRRSRALLVVAAALVLVVAVGALVLSGGNGGRQTMPGNGGDPFGDSVVLGPPVDVETVTVNGEQMTHQAVLSDQTGKGPSLCDRYGTDAGGSGGCSSRDPSADDPDVAFDWLTATTGGGDIRGVLAGVDSRVMKVQIWMDNGDMVPAILKPGTWEGTKLFALTVPSDGPHPQLLVAFADATGRVLQSVDLADRLGTGWLPPGGKHCAGSAAGTWPQPGSGDPGGVSVALWSSSAEVTVVAGSDTVGTTCLGLRSGALAGSVSLGGHLVVVAGPGVVTVELRTTSGATVPGSSRKVAPTTRSPFQVADLPEPPSGGVGYRIVALDVTGQVVDRTDYSTVAD